MEGFSIRNGSIKKEKVIIGQLALADNDFIYKGLYKLLFVLFYIYKSRCVEYSFAHDWQFKPVALF